MHAQKLEVCLLHVEFKVQGGKAMGVSNDHKRRRGWFANKMAMQSLRGGPSYNYNYWQDLDPTERQYLQEQALQESQAGGFLGQSNYQVKQSYSQSYWQQQYGRAEAGFGAIPEHSEIPSFQQGDLQQSVFERRYEIALQSWKMGGAQLKPQSEGGPPALSSNSSSIDLKEFVTRRGEKNLDGLHKLASQGDRNGIMNFMKQHGPNAPIDDLDANGCTPLMYAAMADSRLAIEMLLNFSARREQTDPEGRTAVHYAAFFGKHRALKFLITAAADWAPMDNYGRTPLHWACVSKSTQALAVLLKHSQIVMGSRDPPDHEGMTPLHCAAHFCRPRHVEMLHEAGCSFSAVDCEQKTALHWTASNPDPSCIQVLVDLYPSLLNKQDDKGSTILHCAAQQGATHLVTALLETPGIDIDVKDGYERTALHWACAGDHTDIVSLLLNSSALDSCIDSNGLTALHYCVQNKSVSSTEAFVGVKDMTHLPSNEGRTPLMEAAAADIPEVVRALLRHRVVVRTIDKKDPQGMSSLHLAAECGSSESVTALLSKGANPNLLDSIQRPPLILAAQNGHGGCIQALASKGCKMDLFDGEGQAALHKAVMYDQLEAVQVLAMNGIDLNIRDTVGNTALHMAAYGGSNPVLMTLLNQSANPNLQDANGASPVHLAAMEGRSECLATLVTHGAYLNFVDFSEERYTPVDYARLHNHLECVEILTSAGGVATEDIRGLAALTIQTVYRGFRARRLRSELSVRKRAAICLGRHIRGFIQRRRFADMRRRHLAAIKIQAFYRGHAERVRFRLRLSRFREHSHHWKLIENFSALVQKGREEGTLKTFVSEDLSPERVEEDVEILERERKLRLETSMKMRAIYQERQKRWQQFRDLEKQRRKDKASVIEMNHLNNIIKESRARREYTCLKFQQTLSVRSYYSAALVIQRAYRRVKVERAVQTRVLEQEALLVRSQRERAALAIQRVWRRYQQRKLFEAIHFMSIMSGPVIAVERRVPSPPGAHSYERGISITGSPKRKVHQTCPSRFHVFRPLTRDLLQGATANHQSYDYPFTRPDSLIVVEGSQGYHHVEASGGRGGRKGGRGSRRITLPRLPRVTKATTLSPQTGQKPIVLPDIPNK